MSKDDLADFTRLFIIEKFTRELLLKEPHHTRRYNQLKGALGKTIATAETYAGTLPDKYVEQCNDMMNEIEKSLEAV